LLGRSINDQATSDLEECNKYDVTIIPKPLKKGVVSSLEPHPIRVASAIGGAIPLKEANCEENTRLLGRAGGVNERRLFNTLNR
jgi:hypothetical protein